MSGSATRTDTWGALVQPLHAAIGAADRVRREWFRLLGRPGRALVRDRELRVSVLLSVVTITTLVGTLWIPLWLLALGPVLWGTPHLVSDLRYLVIRTGFAERTGLWLAGGIPLAWLAFGGDLVVGFVGGCAVALLARAPWAHKVAAAAALAVLGLGFAALGSTGEVVFGHAHNFFAIALWWWWRPRSGRRHWVPLVLMVVVTAFLLSPLSLALAQIDGGPAGVGQSFQLWRLAGGAGPELGLRLVLLFCFSQSVHYVIWVHSIPDEDRERATPVTFRASVQGLRRDFGDVGLAVATALAVGIAGWALWDLAAANHGYFRMARFHGHLELMAAVLLVLERKSGK
ncbi:MAG: hypothetical protein AAF799_17070 [Myxococcota bacterium]